MNNTSTFRRNARRGAAALVIGGAAAGALATAPANADSLDWDAVAQCESGGDWSTSTGNGFSGGLQFTPSTWSSFGGQGDPQNASKEQQIQVAERVLAEQGPGAWPVCSQQAGSGDSGSGQQEQAQPQQDVQAQSQDVQEFQAPAEQAQPEQAPVEQAPVEQAQPEVQQVPEQQTYEAPAQEQVAAPVQSSAATHTVSVGETLKSIADQYGVSVDALVQANGSVVTNPDLIFPGQTLEIPAA